MTDPPPVIGLSLDEAILLVGALEDALMILERLVDRTPLRVVDVMGPAMGLEYQLRVLNAKLGWTGGGPHAC